MQILEINNTTYEKESCCHLNLDDNILCSLFGILRTNAGYSVSKVRRHEAIANPDLTCRLCNRNSIPSTTTTTRKAAI